MGDFFDAIARPFGVLLVLVGGLVLLVAITPTWRWPPRLVGSAPIAQSHYLLQALAFLGCGSGLLLGRETTPGSTLWTIGLLCQFLFSVSLIRQWWRDEHSW